MLLRGVNDSPAALFDLCFALGRSYWTKNYRTAVEAEDPLALGREYAYYDPIYMLPDTGQGLVAGTRPPRGAGVRAPRGRLSPVCPRGQAVPSPGTPRIALGLPGTPRA